VSVTKTIFRKEYGSGLSGRWIWDVRYKAEVIADYVSKHTSGLSVMDCGCGFGVLLDLLERKGYDELKGVDLFVVDSKQDLRMLDLNTDFKLPKTSIVVCSHTLQYLKYPGSAFVSMVRDRPEEVLLVVPLRKKSVESGMINEFTEGLITEWADLELYDLKKTYYFGGWYNKFFKGLLAAHSHLTKKNVGRREYADSSFRKLLLLIGVKLKFIDSWSGMFEKKNALFHLTRLPIIKKENMDVRQFTVQGGKHG